MADIPTSEPTTLRAGDTWQWTRSDLTADYPASSWTLTYYLLKTGVQKTFTATASGDAFAVTVAASTTAGYAAGTYTLFGRASKSGVVETVYEGQLVVLPDLGAASSGYDTRTHARKTLDAIESVIENRASADVQEYVIGDRQLKKIPPLELLSLRDKYRAEVRAEEDAANAALGRPTSRRILTRFASCG